MDDINIFEFEYTSQHPQHQFKRREVALYLLGSFSEDISMFRVRNPEYNFKALVNEALTEGDYEAARIKSYLKGRVLWCAN